MEILSYNIPISLMVLYVLFSIILASVLYDYYADLTNEKINKGQINLNTKVKRYSFITMIVVICVISGVLWPIFVFLSLIYSFKGNDEDNHDENGSTYAF